MKQRSVRVLVSSVLMLILNLTLLGCGESTDGDSAPRASDSRSSDPDPIDVSRLREILEEPDRVERMGQLVAALRAIPAERADVLRDFLQDRDMPYRAVERVVVIAAWADHDAPAATAWAVGAEMGDMRTLAAADAARKWARHDPEAVLRKFDVAQMAPHVPGLLIGLVEGWFEAEDSRSLDDYVRDLGAGNDRQRALTTLAKLHVAREGSDGAIRWAESVSSADLTFRMRLFERVAEEIAKTEPERAVAWCERVCDTKEGEWLPGSIVRNWAQYAGADAMDWVMSRPDDQPTRLAVRIGYLNFMTEDPEGALAWMERTSEDQRRDARLEGPIESYITRQSRAGDRQAAIEWTRYLADEAKREGALVSIARRWREVDLEAAEAWLAQSPLSADARERARRPPKKRLKGA